MGVPSVTRRTVLAGLGLLGLTVPTPGPAATPAFLVWRRPNDPQQGAYQRFITDHVVAGSYTFEAKITPMPPAPPAVRLTMDGTPFTGWLAPPYLGLLDTRTLPNGSHLLSAETTDPTVVVIALAIRIANGGVLTGPQPIWTAETRYEAQFDRLARGSAGQADYDGAPPIVEGSVAPPVVAESWGGRLSADQLWVTRLGTEGQMIRRFTAHPDGGVSISPTQQYFYADRARLSVGNGPLDRVHEIGYPWLIVPGAGQLWVAGNSGHWSAVITRRRPEHPIPDVARYRRGQLVYAHGTVPALELRHGEGGAGALGLPTFAEMATWADADIIAYWQEVAPTLTLEQLGDLLYYLRWLQGP